MKTFKTIITPIAVILIVAISCLHIAYAQDEKAEKKASKAANIKSLLDSQNFVFHAQRVLPARGSVRQLTPEYDIAILKDSIVSYLPYFGRAYTAPYNPNDVGLKFTSTHFKYTKKYSRKGWYILIEPEDHTEVQQLSFDIFDNGSASLRINSLNREPISFQGYITARKQKK